MFIYSTTELKHEFILDVFPILCLGLCRSFTQHRTRTYTRSATITNYQLLVPRPHSV